MCNYDNHNGTGDKIESCDDCQEWFYISCTDLCYKQWKVHTMLNGILHGTVGC